MNDSNLLRKVKEDLSFCKEYWVVLFGSHVNGTFIQSRSDIDVAIITRNRNRPQNFKTWCEILGEIPPLYDLKVFELLPLIIQIEIIKNYNVIFGDPLEISEYFYRFRTIWKDEAIRFKNNQFHSIREKLEAIVWMERFKK